jgi:hypothetical protein
VAARCDLFLSIGESTVLVCSLLLLPTLLRLLQISPKLLLFLSTFPKPVTATSLLLLPELVSAAAGADVDWAGSENAAACGSSKGWHELSVFWFIPVVAVIFWRDGFFQLGKGQMLKFTYCNFDGE